MLGLDKVAVLDGVEKFRLALANQGIRASRIILFGSYVRGDWHEGSDIDLAIVSPDFEGKGFWERVEMLAQAICEVWLPIEALAYTPAEWEEGESLAIDFAKQGEVVYSE